jgi:RimJ/RimL family protein N-acetyltransferase
MNYYQQMVVPLFSREHPSQLLFSLLLDNKCIGYGGIVHISWSNLRGEISFLVDPERLKIDGIYREDFSAFLAMIKEVAFEHLGFNRIFTETFDIRDEHIGILEASGFLREGRLREHVMIGGSFVDAVMHGFIKTDYKHGA